MRQVLLKTLKFQQVHFTVLFSIVCDKHMCEWTYLIKNPNALRFGYAMLSVQKLLSYLEW